MVLVLLAGTSLPGCGGGARERFQALDRNGDGRISAAEAGRPALMRRYDRNGDGYVTREEARAARRRGADEVIQPRVVREPDVEISVDDDIRLISNERYADVPGADPNLLSLDIYTRARNGGSALPVVVMVHGGGWQGGDKANAEIGPEKAEFIVPLGFVYVAVNYRLSPAVKHPTHVQDVARAINWVDEHIHRYGGDRQRIFLMGHSAGAHLAALVSTDESYLARWGKRLSLVKGVILLDTAGYDIPRAIEQAEGDRSVRMFEAAFGTDRKVWRDASPQFHIARGKGIPPFLVAYSEDAKEYREDIALDFIRSLRDADVEVRGVPTRGKTHKEMKDDAGDPGDVLTLEIRDFLRKHVQRLN
jgi:acetyl esterase/lipase